MNKTSKKLGRRRTLVVLTTTALAAGGLLALGGCKGGDKKEGGGEDKAAGGTGCDTPIDAKSKKQRKTLQYVAKSPDPAKNCGNCAQWIAGKYGDCGGCKLFEGPVVAGGYCASYAPTKAEGAASAEPASSG